MKLIFIGNTAWGMYNFRRFVLQHFIKCNSEVIVISPEDCEFQNLLKLIGCKCYSINIEAKGNNPIKDLRMMWQIRKIMKLEKPDFCFFYTIKPNIYGSMAAASLNIPYIPVTTGLGYIFLVDNWISKIAKVLYKVAFRKAKQVWFLNQDDVDAFRKEKLVDDNKISILKGEGINVSRFEVQHNQLELSFLLVARMLWDKGVGEYVEAAKILKEKYPDVRFKLLGFLGVDNPSAISKHQMDKWIQEGYVEYLGATKDVRPYLYDVSCIVLPSYREGISFSLMEGAASGKPLIATDTVGCKELIEDEVTGFLCKLKDSEDLAEKMEKIILMPENDRIQMGLKGREKMKTEFSIDVVINKYVEAIKTQANLPKDD